MNAAPPFKHPLVPALRPIQTPAEYQEVMDAARADGAHTLPLSHTFRLGGKLVGAVGIDAVPLHHFWVRHGVPARQSAEMIAAVDAVYAARGVRQVWSLLDPQSPFVAVGRRFGYYPIGHSVVVERNLWAD